MTTKAYIMHELEGRGFSRFDDLPDEMLDYMPEYMEDEDEELIINDGRESPWYVHII